MERSRFNSEVLFNSPPNLAGSGLRRSLRLPAIALAGLIAVLASNLHVILRDVAAARGRAWLARLIGSPVAIHREM